MMKTFFVALVVIAQGAVDDSLCTTAVSVILDTNNAKCAEVCNEIVSAGEDPHTNTTYTESCGFAHYNVVNNNVKPTGTCFDTLVYGYSEGSVYDSIIPNLHTSTPALCQSQCQDNVDCVQWSWASDYVSGSGTQRRCLLKSKDMLEGALAQKTGEGQSDVNTQYCAPSTVAYCSPMFPCLECGGFMRCALESAVHISGWKYCADTKDSCLPFGEYAQCKEYAAIDASWTNDDCFFSCNLLWSEGGEAAVEGDAEFSEHCAKEHYYVGQDDNRAHPIGTCYDNIVFGYTENNKLSSMEDAQGLFADTPAACQLLCQQHSGCVAFAFVTEAIDESHSDETYRCLLKNAEMVSEALKMNVAAEAPIINSEFCSLDIPDMCKTTYECVTCAANELSCAWESVYHIGGQRHCAQVQPVCDLE